jgi:hypothetical protein
MIPVGILTAAATSSFTFLLDLYPGAVAAYSFRKLRSTYTGFCCQTYDTTNGLVNVGFVNNYVDLTTLQNLGANLFITIWYDQSGNGNNIASNLASGGKLKIANVLQNINGKLSSFFDTEGASNYNSINLKNGFSNFTAAKINTTTNVAYTFAKDVNDIANAAVQGSNQWGLYRSAVGAMLIKNNQAPTVFSLFTAYYDGLNIGIKLNSVTQNTGTFSNTVITNTVLLAVPYNTAPGGTNHSNISESIFYQNNQLANQSAIEANINTFYTIY